MNHSAIAMQHSGCRCQHPRRKRDITDTLISDLFRPNLDDTLAVIRDAVEAHTTTEAFA